MSSSIAETHRPGVDITAIRDRWAATTPGPWFWWGNTDSGNEALCGRQPGLGVCEVLSTIDVDRTPTDKGAKDYREFLAGEQVFDAALDGYRALTPDERDQRVRDDYLTDAWGGPRRDTKLALTDGENIRRALPEVAVYRVARAQMLPDDTPREHPSIYRADIVDVRNPNGKALASAWSDVHTLLSEVKSLQGHLIYAKKNLRDARMQTIAERNRADALQADIDTCLDKQSRGCSHLHGFEPADPYSPDATDAADLMAQRICAALAAALPDVDHIRLVDLAQRISATEQMVVDRGGQDEPLGIEQSAIAAASEQATREGW